MSISPELSDLPNRCAPELALAAQRDPAKTGSGVPQSVDQSAIRTPFHVAATGIKGRTTRRRITQQAGVALEALGHAIEYLADEYAHEAGSIPSIHSRDPRLEAIQTLMAANREVYYACPVLPSFWQRLKRRLFGPPQPRIPCA